MSYYDYNYDQRYSNSDDYYDYNYNYQSRPWATRYYYFWNVHREKSMPTFWPCHQLSEMVWHSNIHTHVKAIKSQFFQNSNLPTQNTCLRVGIWGLLGRFRILPYHFRKLMTGWTFHLSKGRPYDVVDELCESTILDYSMCTASLLPTFFDL